LRNKVYLGGDQFVEDMQCKTDPEASLRDVPSVQKRQVPKPLKYYEKKASSRNEAIKLAYASGGYSMCEIFCCFSC